MEPVPALWNGCSHGLVLRRRTNRWIHPGGPALGRGLLPVFSLSLHRQGRFSTGAPGTILVDAFYCNIPDLWIGASRMAGGHTLRSGLSRIGLLEEKTRGRHPRPRHRKSVAWSVGGSPRRVEILVTRQLKPELRKSEFGLTRIQPGRLAKPARPDL